MNFELWLFTIKRLGTTMDVTMTIFNSMSPDRQKRLRDEYDREYGNCNNINNEKGSKPKVRITVLKKECFPALQKEYLSHSKSGVCPLFEEGQVFTADMDNYSRCMDGKFCADAWDALNKYIYAGLLGGSFKKGCKNNKVMLACCNDGTRPVIFKLEILDK